MSIRFGHAVFALIIASILNLAIAWLCAYYNWPSFQGAILLSADEFDSGIELVTERDHELAVANWTAFGVTVLDCHGPWIILKDVTLKANNAPTVFIFKNAHNNEPLGQYILRFEINNMLYHYSKLHTRIDTGWPMRSFRGFVSGGKLDPNKSPTLFPLHEITVIASERELNNTARPRYLPFGPILFGLIVNTLVYATVIYTIMWMLTAARSKLRLRCGLCPNCKYPIGVSEVCTECGRALPVEKIGCH